MLFCAERNAQTGSCWLHKDGKEQLLSSQSPQLGDRPEELCTRLTSSPARNGVAGGSGGFSWEHAFLFGGPGERDMWEVCGLRGLLSARRGRGGSTFKQSRWKWWNGTVCQLSPASASSTKTVSVVTQLIPITVAERGASQVRLLPSAVHLQAVGQMLPVKYNRQSPLRALK